MPNRPRPRDLLIGVIASAIAGLLVGALGTFKHQFGVSAATGEGLPIGLVLSIAMVVLVVGALRVAFVPRWYAGAAWLGVVAAIALLSQPGPSGGSTVIIGNTVGAVWIVAPAVLAGVVVAWPRRRRNRGARGTGGILQDDPAVQPAGMKDD